MVRYDDYVNSIAGFIPYEFYYFLLNLLLVSDLENKSFHKLDM